MLANNILPTIVSTVKKYGNTLSLNQISGGGVYDPTTGTISDGTPVQTPFKGATSIASAKDEIGTIQRGDLMVTAVFDNVTPDIKNSITYNALEYSIVDLQPIYFQDILMVYKIIARRG